MTAPWLEHRWRWMGGPSFRSGRGEGMGGEQGWGMGGGGGSGERREGRASRRWGMAGGAGEGANGSTVSGGREGGAWRGKADAISETRGKARFFGYAAGDGRSRKRVRDWTPNAGRLCGITCLFLRCPKQGRSSIQTHTST